MDEQESNPVPVIKIRMNDGFIDEKTVLGAFQQDSTEYILVQSKNGELEQFRMKTKWFQAIAEQKNASFLEELLTELETREFGESFSFNHRLILKIDPTSILEKFRNKICKYEIDPFIKSLIEINHL